jgi:hypothetical protein
MFDHPQRPILRREHQCLQFPLESQLRLIQPPRLDRTSDLSHVDPSEDTHAAGTPSSGLSRGAYL